MMQSSDYLHNYRDIVRFRPGLWLGSMDIWGLHYLLYMVIDNSIDQAQVGKCSHLSITLQKGNTVTVADNGTGIPTEVYEDSGKPLLELILTREIGKFDPKTHKFIRTFFGGGLPAVNALSSFLEVKVARDGNIWKQTYKAGIPQNELTKLGTMGKGQSTGTAITFTPDYTIFEQNDFQYLILQDRLRDLASLASGLSITLRDERAEIPVMNTYYFEHGLLSYVDFLRADYLPVHSIISAKSILEFEPKQESRRKFQIEFIAQYTTNTSNLELSFACRYKLMQGRPHMYGLRAAFEDFINHYSYENGVLIEGDLKFSSKEVLAGLITIVNFPDLHPTAQPSEDVSNLAYPELKEVIYSFVTKTLEDFAKQNPQQMLTVANWLLSKRYADRAIRATI